ncbi:DsrE family protein [Polluticoccus soli]|uniref:DsrE family protein n=1 Tax=Polluticoccus soli TaxID=3034150 RepID=UPI0023E2185C|nr:DsrE family protein [Flavipsychrobacter sp. JY13-12]
MIKKQISIFLFLLFASMVAIAQTTGEDNLLFLLRKKEHLAQALVTAEQLRSSEKTTTINPGEIVIILCGEEVKMLTEPSSVDLIKNAERLNVNVVACGLSLNKFNLSRQQLLPGVRYVTNGFIKAFELQKQGYLSVEL